MKRAGKMESPEETGTRSMTTTTPEDYTFNSFRTILSHALPVSLSLSLALGMWVTQHTQSHTSAYIALRESIKTKEKHFFMYFCAARTERGTLTYFGGQMCVLHCTTAGSGRVIALHRDSSTSALVTRFRHVGRDIL